jgi:hypothetical protein
MPVMARGVKSVNPGIPVGNACRCKKYDDKDCSPHDSLPISKYWSMSKKI